MTQNINRRPGRYNHTPIRTPEHIRKGDKSLEQYGFKLDIPEVPDMTPNHKRIFRRDRKDKQLKLTNEGMRLKLQTN